MTDQRNSYSFAYDMIAAGHLPLDVVKALRKEFGMTLEQAFDVVVTPAEIHIFLDANKCRGVARSGAIRLLQKVYGLPLDKAETYVTLSGNWTDDANSLSVELQYPEHEEEMDMKGWRADITVRANGKTFKPTFYNPLRLRQDIERWEETKDGDFIEEMVVLQESLLNDAIRDRVKTLFRAGYFD